MDTNMFRGNATICGKQTLARGRTTAVLPGEVRFPRNEIRTSRLLLALGLGLTLLGGGSVASQAATIGFEGGNGPVPYSEAGYLVSGDGSPPSPTIVGGNCASGSCLSISDPQSPAILTTDPAGGTFDVTSFWFQFLGQGNSTGDFLTVTPSTGSLVQIAIGSAAPTGVTLADGNPVVGNLIHNTAYLWTGLLAGVTSVNFSTGNAANLRIDNINAIPLPPAALLFGSALAGMGFLGRRRKAAVRA